MADQDFTQDKRFGLGIYKRGKYYYTEFTANGERFRRALKTTDEQEALRLAAEFKNSIHPFCPHEPEFANNDWVAKVYHQAKRRAKERGIDFELTKKHADALFANAGNYCQLTGMPFSFKKDERYTKRPFIPTIDRIDNSKGYVDGNCRIICLVVNIALNEWGEEIFNKMVDSYYLHRSRHKNRHMAYSA